MLAPHEPRAALRGIKPPQRRALIMCLDFARLDFIPRENSWRHPGGNERVEKITINALVARDLMVIVKGQGFTRTAHARLTARGTWYARTIITKTMHTAAEFHTSRGEIISQATGVEQ